MAKYHHLLLFLLLQALSLHRCSTFVIPLSKEGNTLTIRTSCKTFPFPSKQEGHIVLRKQRRSIANIQTQGIFGLGAPEIAIILVAAAFLVGPQQIGSMVGKLKDDFGDAPDELKRIPEEFQEGFKEAGQTARARNAKKMEPVHDPPSLPTEADKEPQEADKN
jgi:sec-independent protein translocase protein TatA